MRINGFRCDGCGKEHLLKDRAKDSFNLYQDLPEKWFVFSQGPITPLSSDPLMFCSPSCVIKHMHTYERPEPTIKFQSGDKIYEERL